MDHTLQTMVKKALTVFTVFLVLASVFVVVLILRGGSAKNYDTLTVDAESKVFAAPDIAEISFSLRSQEKELAKAQTEVESQVAPTVDALIALGIDEKDIKTNYYTANPRYEYGKAICAQYRCDDGERALVGYEVVQSMQVTVRDLDIVGKALGALGSLNVSELYGPNFRIEDEENLKTQAREEAITKAKAKAKTLAKSLGVRIVGIENFSEGYGGGIFYAAKAGAEDSSMSPQVANVTLPQGENTITSNVTITYRVR